VPEACVTSAGSRHVRLGGGGEFDLIRTFLESAPPLPDAVRVGPGDDCAVIDAAPLALSADLSVEDVHFRRAWLSPEEIGWRAAASALSDLAAVAAQPIAVLVSLALTADDVASGWGTKLMSGVQRAAQSADAGVVGGDVSRSTGPAVVDVTVVGRSERPVLRSGARPGDEVWVTGHLGGAAAAVALLERGGALPDALRARFAHPVARTREALWLAGRAELHALIDLSDGLGGDLGHVAAASEVAIELDPSLVPIAPDVEAASDLGEGMLALALFGGEDYELCVVAPEGALGPLVDSFQGRFGIPLTRVGYVHAGEGVWTRDADGSEKRLERVGFSHFATATDSAARTRRP
jgi:thiamine-monophosphate kinase